MARYQIIIAYDGTEFFGFQRQDAFRTVQSEIELALQKIGWNGKSIQAAGRTDTGVHASGQVIAVDFEWKHSLDAFIRALNANLPADVSALKAVETSPGFHPRFDASSRRYIYRVYCAEQRNPLRERYAWRLWPEPDFSVMKDFSQVFVGEHDFRYFGKPMKPGGNTVRRVIAAEWRQEREWKEFSISANAFLYHMVRRIVFVLVQAGYGRLTKDDLLQAMERKVPLPAGLAPPHGLDLAEVAYEMNLSERNENWQEIAGEIPEL